LIYIYDWQLFIKVSIK